MKIFFKNYRIFILAFVASLCNQLSAQNLSGKVVNLASIGIENALVLRENNKAIWVKTNSDGSFTIPGVTGDKLRFAALHFETKKNVGATSNMTVVLGKDLLEVGGDVYHLGFDHMRPGARYTEAEAKNDLPIPSAAGFYDGDNINDRASVDYTVSRDANGQSLKVKYPKEQAKTASSGIDTKIPLANNYNNNMFQADDLYLSYWVKFSDDFNFDLCGGKLPSLGGSDFGTRDNEWKGRIMWANGGSMRFYMELPGAEDGLGIERWWGKPKPHADGSDNSKDNDICLPQYPGYLSGGGWHNIELHYKLDKGNLADGGLFEGWVDGANFSKIGSEKFGYYRPKGTGQDNLTINSIRLSTFFGGANNATWWPSKDEYAWYDEFRVSRTRVNEWGKYNNLSVAESKYDNSDVNVFPNPNSSGEFSITEEAKWEVYSLQGSLVKSGKGKLVDISAQANGVYLLKVNNITKKIVKQ